MDLLTFIFGVVITIFVFLTIVCVAGIRYESIRLESENEKLKEKLRKRTEREFKKNDK